MKLPYPVDAMPSYLVDHKTMRSLHTVCSQAGAKIALIGFNEAAKHLVNLCGDAIVGFYDPAVWKQGITFRGKPVVGDSDKLDINRLAICDFTLAYDFAASISELYDDALPVYCPPRLDENNTDKIDPFRQESIYKNIFAQEASAPISMMKRDKMSFLMEMLQYALGLPGDILEMGVWQGGSAWHIAKVLQERKEDRHIYLVDLFERLVDNRNATMCNDEIARVLDFYPHVTMISGLVNEPKVLKRLGPEKFCFAHYDLGMYKLSLDLIWRNLAPGAPLILDNYGHLASYPVKFERFFAERGARIIRLPWSEQGIVFKHFA